MALSHDIQRVHDFFAPAAQADVKVAYKPRPEETALLVIDAQRMFCDPSLARGTRTTKKICQRIQSIAPAFRKAGIAVYAVYTGHKNQILIPPLHFYGFMPEKGDVLVPKNHNSAFQGSDLMKALKKNGHKNLLACGFNLRACVEETVTDGLANGFNICVLRDLSGNDKPNTKVENSKGAALRRMRAEGAVVATSADVLRLFKSKPRKPEHKK
jgi:ureidoacrylate peracid hydrolase